MDGIIWGDVATWVTGVMTGGSLLLGFKILRNDRRKEEWSQAGRVLCWVMRDIPRDSEEGFAWSFMVTNTSDQPITTPAVIARFEDNRTINRHVQKELRKEFEKNHQIVEYVTAFFYSLKGAPDVLEPGDRIITTLDLPLNQQAFELSFQFVDAGNRIWERDIRSGDLYYIGSRNRPLGRFSKRLVRALQSARRFQNKLDGVESTIEWKAGR